ncbi:hypothetical protein FACS1894179_10030 [Bacteroidia bacterium]|nr:hypothetical protein FACS1894169_02980 [Bacteroidia bacterium]GHV41708.1 hypothetical protein FACS1894179_10030 [Bacteroidia bacterium]
MKVNIEKHNEEMRTRFLTLILLFFLLVSHSQAQQDSIKSNKNVQAHDRILQLEVPIYKLFPTENYWTFIKLDTRNGKMWQVSNDGDEGVQILNSRSLVRTEEDEINGRFTLYPTENKYNFLLLDQISGRTYQVQWDNDSYERFVTPIF